jgi:AAA15 family ATPase/GTPase
MGAPSIFVKLKKIQRKVPIHVVSEGMNKVVSLLLGVSHWQNGVIYVDEIENGIYFNRMKPFWELLQRFAKEYRSQVFASTHSDECLKAAADALDPKDFCLIQVHRHCDASTARIAQGTDAEAAIHGDIEVRR